MKSSPTPRSLSSLTSVRSLCSTGTWPPPSMATLSVPRVPQFPSTMWAGVGDDCNAGLLCVCTRVHACALVCVLSTYYTVLSTLHRQQALWDEQQSQ